MLGCRDCDFDISAKIVWRCMRQTGCQPRVGSHGRRSQKSSRSRTTTDLENGRQRPSTTKNGRAENRSRGFLKKLVAIDNPLRELGEKTLLIEETLGQRLRRTAVREMHCCEPRRVLDRRAGSFHEEAVPPDLWRWRRREPMHDHDICHNVRIGDGQQVVQSVTVFRGICGGMLLVRLCKLDGAEAAVSMESGQRPRAGRSHFRMREAEKPARFFGNPDRHDR
mmetsp:Transcript_91720/g.294851  ORF Transcript_91720/g.294851 Transcript_91720/m.294851 type:complete len:223 (+) Transcript_91720:145-813(+)